MVMKIQNKLGIFLKEMRLQKGLSQEKVAELVGVHRTYIGMVERGEKNITIATLEKFAKVYEVKIWHIFKEIDI